jgi:hypothetical protein
MGNWARRKQAVRDCLGIEHVNASHHRQQKAERGTSGLFAIRVHFLC